MASTELRAAAQQALEALELAKLNGKAGMYPAEIEEIADAIAALRAALAEQAQPVAWAITDHGNVIYLNDDREDSEREFRKYGSRSGMALLPLYTTPPAPVVPQPLTELPPLPPKDVLHDLHDEPCPACNTMLRALPPIKLGYTAEQMRAYGRAVEAEVLKRMGVQR